MESKPKKWETEFEEYQNVFTGEYQLHVPLSPLKQTILFPLKRKCSSQCSEEELFKTIKRCGRKKKIINISSESEEQFQINLIEDVRKKESEEPAKNIINNFVEDNEMKNKAQIQQSQHHTKKQQYKELEKRNSIIEEFSQNKLIFQKETVTKIKQTALTNPKQNLKKAISKLNLMYNFFQ